MGAQKGRRTCWLDLLLCQFQFEMEVHFQTRYPKNCWRIKYAFHFKLVGGGFWMVSVGVGRVDDRDQNYFNHLPDFECSWPCILAIANAL